MTPTTEDLLREIRELRAELSGYRTVEPLEQHRLPTLTVTRPVHGSREALVDRLDQLVVMAALTTEDKVASRIS